MDEIDGATWRLIIRRWALSPYEVLAGKLMFCNEYGRDNPPRNVDHARPHRNRYPLPRAMA